MVTRGEKGSFCLDDLSLRVAVFHVFFGLKCFFLSANFVETCMALMEMGEASSNHSQIRRRTLKQCTL